MTTFLIISLILLDVGLAVCFFFLNRRQEAHQELVEELTEERQILTELRASVQEELKAAQGQARASLDKVARLAAEAEHEVKSGGQTLAKEMEGVVGSLTERFESPLRQLGKKQASVEAMLRRIDREKKILGSLVARGEKICKFFDDKIPYEEVLNEISDKKYSDARHLLAKGDPPALVAKELGMSESEVRLVAGLAGRG